MSGTFVTNGVVSDQFTVGQGAVCSGIGLSPITSGPTKPGEVVVADAANLQLARIGGGSQASAASNLGNMVTSVAFVAGSGYTNGVYIIESTGGGKNNGEAAIQVTVAGGAITLIEILRPGSGFASAPTFALTALGAGTGGSITPSIATNPDIVTLGTGWGSNKGIRRVVANGASAANAAIPPSTYLNRSGRAMVSGEVAVGVAP